MSYEEELADGMVDVARGRQRPEGWILAHNRVRHTKHMENGRNGFRYFWRSPEKSKDWIICDCGWRPKWGVHYCHRNFAGYKCEKSVRE